jgi:hypothetical protein
MNFGGRTVRKQPHQDVLILTYNNITPMYFWLLAHSVRVYAKSLV